MRTARHDSWRYVRLALRCHQSSHTAQTWGAAARAVARARVLQERRLTFGFVGMFRNVLRSFRRLRGLMRPRRALSLATMLGVASVLASKECVVCGLIMALVEEHRHLSRIL